MLDTTNETAPQVDRAPRYWFRFSLKSLLLVTALIAVYFGGRASPRPHWFAPRTGTWQLTMKGGHQRMVTLTSFPDKMFLLNSAGNLGGKYRWEAGQLIVQTPNDKRYAGLAWKWDNDDLVLIAEPTSRPSGASYVGARMTFISSEIAKPHSPPTKTLAPPVPENTKHD